jgi:hypothetical protein
MNWLLVRHPCFKLRKKARSNGFFSKEVYFCIYVSQYCTAVQCTVYTNFKPYLEI